VQQGWEPLQAFWLGENFGRYTESMQPGERDVFFYIPVVLGDLFPWTLFVVGGLVWGVRALWDGESPIARLLMLWIVWHVGVFSLSQTKQDLYIFPIVPALAALAACVLVWGLEHGARWIGRAAVVTAVLMAAIGVGTTWLFGVWAQIHQIAGANVLAAIVITGAVLVCGLVWRSRVAWAVSAIAVTFVAANYVFALVSLPATEAYKPVLPMVKVINARTPPGEPPPVVAHYRTVLPSMAYYLGRPIEHIFDMPTLLARSQQVPAMYVLFRPAEFEEFQMRVAPAKVPTCIVSRHTLFEAKLRFVLEGKPWPQVYLAGTGTACAR
jgi:4-amino-4-deoxy-L-arabinose transferase-like glycosyltransferase